MYKVVRRNEPPYTTIGKKRLDVAKQIISSVGDPRVARGTPFSPTWWHGFLLLLDSSLPSLPCLVSLSLPDVHPADLCSMPEVDGGYPGGTRRRRPTGVPGNDFCRWAQGGRGGGGGGVLL